MKLKDAIALIDVNQAAGHGYNSAVFEDEDIGRWALLTGYNLDDFNNSSDEFAKRMRKHAIYSWTCTDTVVGIFVYCLDKQPVSAQVARKSQCKIAIINREAYHAIKKAVGEYQQHPDLDFADLDLDISAWAVKATGGKYSFNIEHQ
jgi:hypothetical protein